MSKTLVLLLILLTCLPTVCAQEEEPHGARGIFIRTRKGSPRQTTQAPPAPGAARRPARTRRRRPPVHKGAVSNPPAPPAQERLVGIGYTLYLKKDEGRFVSVSPNRTFRTGDAVRLLVETNIDGYLYVLHQENDGPPKMMFPCSLAWDGDNRIWAHRPLFISPITEMRFTGDPAIETLTLIVSRNRLPALASGHQLTLSRCDTPVPARALDSILRRPCQCSADERLAEGQRMPTDTFARDMEMVASDPAPNHIFVNQSLLNDILITRVRLNHR